MENVNLLIQAVVSLVGAAAAYFVLRTKVHKDATIEADRLLSLRADRIADLEAEVDNLSTRMSKMEAELDAVRKMQTTRIIEGVVEGIIPFLSGGNV